MSEAPRRPNLPRMRRANAAGQKAAWLAARQSEEALRRMGERGCHGDTHSFPSFVPLAGSTHELKCACGAKTMVVHARGGI